MLTMDGDVHSAKPHTVQLLNAKSQFYINAYGTSKGNLKLFFFFKSHQK